MSDEPIFYDSPEAATYRTDICGWVSRKGNFYGKNEDLARLNGMTHRRCRECGALIDARHVICEACSEKAEDAQYMAYRARPIAPDDVMYYSYVLDEFFGDVEDLLELLEGVVLEDVDLTQDLLDRYRVVHCIPTHASIDIDYFNGIIPEDADSDCSPVLDLEDAIRDFNKKMKAVAISWEPDKVRVVL